MQAKALGVERELSGSSSPGPQQASVVGQSDESGILGRGGRKETGAKNNMFQTEH